MAKNLSVDVSVIIPVYNRFDTLKRALNSVLIQTYKNIEVIIVDDGSDSDIGSAIVEYVKSLDDSRVRVVVNTHNRGVSYSRNLGISAGKSEFIAFLDSDDEWLQDKLMRQVEYLKRYPDINLVHTEEIWVRNGVRVNQKKIHAKSGGDIFNRSLHLCLISPSSVLIRRTLIEKYGLFDESMQACEDYDLWLRITAFEDVGFIETPLIIKYGGHEDQLSKKYEIMDMLRCRSLVGLLSNPTLPDCRKHEIAVVLDQKLSVIYNGAVKRGNSSIIDECKRMRLNLQ